ncbi:MAG: LysR family transcriptional regulator [Flavobacteriaceae bacterium]
MRANPIAGLDLTHLRVLDTMLQEQSVRQTAERLCLSPSAISHALAKLRTVTGDQLFIRSANAMLPTARALEIAPMLSEAMRLLEASLAEQHFDPALSTREFRIACFPYIAKTLLPEIMHRLQAEAPNIRLRAWPVTEQLVSDLDNGRLDCAFGSFARVPDWAVTRELFREDMVIVMRQGGPMAGRALAPADLARCAHIDVQTEDESTQHIENFHVMNGMERQIAATGREKLKTVLDQMGLERKVALVTTDTVCALAVVSRTDMMSLVIRRVAECYRQMFALELFTPPYEEEALPIHLIWHKRQDNDPALNWLCSTLAAAAGVYDGATSVA